MASAILAEFGGFMAILPFQPEKREGKPDRWLLSIDLEKVEKMLGAPVTWVLIYDVPYGERVRMTRFRSSPELVLCPHGCVMVDWNDMQSDQSDCRMMDDDPDGPNFQGLVFPASVRYEVTNVDEQLSRIMILSAELTDRWIGEDDLHRFHLEDIALRLGDPVRWIYINNMNPGTIAGNHAHKFKSELFFALHGLFDIQSVEVIIEEDGTVTPYHAESECLLLDASSQNPLPRETEVPPSFAHAVHACGDTICRLLVLATGEPRDKSDDFAFTVIPDAYRHGP